MNDSAPKFLLALAAILTSLPACGGDERPRPQPGWNVVLITVDTYRADHFLESRADRPLTPNLARFSDRSVTFSQASSPACVTSPGTAAILTGLLPRRSGVIVNAHRLPEALPTLTSVLASQGYRTAAFVGNPVLAAGKGFDRDFATYRLVRGDARRDADRNLSARAARWLEGRSEPFFLWVHYMDPHGPYQPPASHRDLFPSEAFRASAPIPLLADGDNSGAGGIPHYQHLIAKPGVQDARDYLARYAGAVRFMDDKVGRLLEELERRALMDRTIIVLTADHSEALDGDHGFYFSHGNGLTQDQVHVPLLLYYPGCDAGESIDRPVSTVDVLATVAELLGQDPIADLDGKSLLLDGPRAVLGQSVHGSSIRRGWWKLYRTGAGLQLFDLRTDPRESENLAEAREEMRDELALGLE